MPARRGTLLAATLMLMVLAAAAAEFAVVESWYDHAVSLVLCVVSFAVGWYCNRAYYIRGGETAADRSLSNLPVAVIVLLVGIFFLPLVVESAHGLVLGAIAPGEVVVLACLRSLGFGLAGLTAWPQAQRLATLASLFLVVSSVVLGEGAWVLYLVGGYAAVGSIWLMVLYWNGLTLDERPGVRRFPWSASAATFLVVAAIVGTAALGPGRAAQLIAELLPSSGGTGDYNPMSRGGVNDGDEEMRGSKDAMSVGFAESDAFKDTPDQSLYDINVDFYGEPLRPKNYDRSVALEARPESDDPNKPAENPRAGREFPTLRREPKHRRRPADRAADALLYIKGPAPAHLRMVIYELFDGTTWYPAPTPKWQPDLDNDGPWMRLPQPTFSQPYLADVARHQIKVGKLQTDRVPAQALLKQFRVGRVDQTHLFLWAQDGVLRVEAPLIPSTTVIETETWTVRTERLHHISFGDRNLEAPLATLRLPESSYLDRRVGELAREWTSSAPSGWQQVDAIVQRLRSEYVHDPDHRPPEDCTDVVGYFLFEARRGPSYLFASSAAMMLRCLGYPTRVVSGFYVDPESYDSRSGHYHVRTEHQHFWAEVRLPNQTWIPIEPTPGYEPSAMVLPLTERLLNALIAAGVWLRQNWLAASATLAAAALLFWRRRRFYDLLATLAWRLRQPAEPRRQMSAALRLIDRRARWAGSGRPPGFTPARWLAALHTGIAAGGGGETAPSGPNPGRLARLADWAAYAPPGFDQPADAHEVDDICKQLVGSWTFRRFQRLARTAQKPESGK